jgi:divalent metal cation (Fe/Co/Zn/Cd) transporter
MATAGGEDRRDVVRRGRRLQYFTVAYNSLEGLVAIVAGLLAGSVSLAGFGFDSLIEVTSGATGLWRLRHDHDAARRERVERATMRIAGACFLALAMVIAWESASALVRRAAPGRSIPGIVVAALSLVAMPLLARAKRRVARALGSGTLGADARQADFCAWLSAILLGGLLLNALLGWWWADPVSALAMVPIIAREGLATLRGETCGCE